jgi:tRNA threonylcarbamoyladenosine modification (KEOPS) complex Cgi121 subunit
MLAKKAEIDMLLRLAGTSQITEAIRKAGCREQGETLLIVAGSDKSIRRLLAARSIRGRRLPAAVLDHEEKMRIEKAAVLSTLRT